MVLVLKAQAAQSIRQAAQAYEKGDQAGAPQILRSSSASLEETRGRFDIPAAAAAPALAPLSSMVWIEIILGLYALVTGIVLMPYLGWSILFWMVIYMLGFFYIAGLNLIQHSVEAD